jgi:uncharacterized protein VirK/YbjX
MLRLKGVLLACCHVTTVPAIFNDWQRRLRSKPELLAGRSPAFALRDEALASLYPRGAPNWLWNRLRFHFRARRFRAETRLWLEWLAEPDLRPLWQARPRLMLKVHRPYLRNDWNGFDRLKALIAHYHVLRELFSPGRRRQIFQQGLTLLQIDAEGPNPFSFSGLVVNLAYLDQFEKEGELTLQVRDSASGLGLAQLSFCFGLENGRRVIRIGGIQAKGDPRTRELINAAAKLCHGLRPKALAVWCLRELARD